MGDQLEIEIEKIVWGGWGLGRHSGLVVFVPKTSPGDRVLCRLVELKKSHARAEILEFLKKAAEHQEPPCPVFWKCGGCDWQHLSSKYQRELKQAFVDEFFPDIPQERKLLSDLKDYAYRSRIDVHKSNGKVGYRGLRSHNLVEIETCLLLEERFRPELVALKVKSGPDGRYRVGAPSEEGFSQVNPSMNQLLRECLLEWVRETGSLSGKTWFELYAGSGNFGFFLFEKEPQLRVWCFESDDQAVSFGHQWLQKRNLSPKKISIARMSAESALRRIQIPDSALVMLDPPREGLSKEVCSSLLKLAKPAARLFYLSCNPSTLKRDLQALSSQWQPQRLQAFDLFPQTHHLEVLVELRNHTNSKLPKESDASVDSASQ
ncbi:MAG: TRAM domain-containing protein [Bdellovibrio sp.]